MKLDRDGFVGKGVKFVGGASRKLDAYSIDNEIEEVEQVPDRRLKKGRSRRKFGDEREGRWEEDNIIPSDEKEWDKIERAVERLVNRPYRDVRQKQLLEAPWLEPLTDDNSHLLHVMNPWASAEFGSQLGTAWEELAKGRPAQAVTIIDQKHDWFESNYGGDGPERLFRIRSNLAAQLRQAFRGRSYLFMLEIALYRTTGDWRWRFCPHLHGAVWAERSCVLGRSDYFSGGFYGADPIDRTELRDDGWFGYMAKDPRLSYVWWRDRHRPGKFKARANPLKTRELKLLLPLFRGVTKPELCFASGVGGEILKQARGLARAGGYVAPKRRPMSSISSVSPDPDLSSLLDGGLEDVEIDPYYTS